MRVLVFTNMYPFEAMPFYGSFVRDEVESLRSAGVDVDVYFVNGKANKLNYFWSPIGFFDRVRKNKYDVVHVHHSFCGFVATKQKKIPVVWTFHEGEITSGTGTIARDSAVKRLAYSKSFKKSVARRVDVLIVVSEHLKAPLERPDALTIASGIDMNLFKPMDQDRAKEKLDLDPGKRYVLFPSEPGRVEKRYDLARSGVEAYNARGSAVELLCLENVPHEGVPLFLNASDALLMTSDFEASPVTVREALACNLPVLSTDVGDVEKVLRGIEGCYIVKPEPSDIADKLDQALSRARPFNGREKMAGYSLPSTAARLIEVYEGLCGRTPDRHHA